MIFNKIFEILQVPEILNVIIRCFLSYLVFYICYSRYYVRERIAEILKILEMIVEYNFPLFPLSLSTL